jgi:4-hydroxy-tetrahydrodipicolinate reductase
MDAEKLRVILSGACGRMGRMIAADFLTSGRVELSAVLDTVKLGEDIGAIVGLEESGLKIVPTLDAALESGGADVFLDFSTLEASLHNLPAALKSGLNCVVGVTGFTDGDIEKLKAYCHESGRVLWVVPNFSLGVNLMMEFAKRAAKYLPDCEIVEMHHDGKRDAPSGTALKTARDLHQAAGAAKPQPGAAPSRGLDVGGVMIHSVRLPGLLAHQEIIFGGRGEVLTIRHDTLSRESFLPGIYMALDKILEKEGFIFGLEGVF